MNVETITVGPLAVNCYIISDPVSNEAILIDPGSESKRIINLIEVRNLKLNSIINTHCHIDHIAEVKTVQDHFKTQFLIHKNELPLLEMLNDSDGLFGINVSGIPEVSDFLKPDQKIMIGKYTGTILFTPGHSPGGISLSISNHVFVGDCLFKDSIGRTDLHGGNYDELITSIKTKLFSLPEDTLVYPGHGPLTTIQYEKNNNPFLR
ncbi:MAG: MBL fold metallo-hydrolase [Calditrichia bacterium]|nr:MBL fold metallo-hydrolase [Calditrichia bacterium]